MGNTRCQQGKLTNKRVLSVLSAVVSSIPRTVVVLEEPPGQSDDLTLSTQRVPSRFTSELQRWKQTAPGC